MTDLKPTRTVLLRAAMAIVITVVAAALAPAAGATFKGKPGPIAFQRVSDPNGDSSDVFRVSPKTGEVTQLTRFPATSWFPDYSPDGRRLSFTRTVFSGEEATDVLFTIGSNGSDPLGLTTGCAGTCLGDSAAAWAPDGTRIVFERAFGPIVGDAAARVDLYVANADGSNETRVPLDLPGREPHDAQWSPDGEWLAFTVLNVGPTRPRSASAIYVVRPDGSGLQQITPLRLNAGGADWSPNGNRIVFNSSYEGQGRVEIYSVRPDGSDLRRVLARPEGQVAFEPVFSPNGRRIALVKGGENALPHIWTMRANGTHLRRLTRGRMVDLQPDWGAR